MGYMAETRNKNIDLCLKKKTHRPDSTVGVGSRTNEDPPMLSNGISNVDDVPTQCSTS